MKQFKERLKKMSESCTDGSQAHHWVIESPKGKYSMGVCKLCKLKRRHENSSDYSNWYGSEHTKKTKRSVSRWDKKHGRSKFEINPSKLSS